MDASGNQSLLSFLAQVPDSRSRHGRQHDLAAVLGLVCCAVLCGARGFAAIGQWGADPPIAFMHRLGFRRKPPTSHGVRKVVIGMDVAAFEAQVARWARQTLGQLPIAGQPPLAVALDGKAVRGSFDALRQAVHLLALVAHQSGLTLAQMQVPSGGEDKTNEHKAALTLWERQTLEGLVITGDAMFCHRDVCAAILAKRGDYFLFVKDNQPTLRRDIEAALAPPPPGAFSPSAAAAVAGGGHPGVHPRQGARPPRAKDRARHHGAERLPGLAGRRPSRRDRIGGPPRR